MTRWYTRPVWSIADMDRSLAFYIGALGFREDWRFEDLGARIVQLSRGECEIILSNQWPERIGRGLAFVSLDDGAAVDTLRTELAGRGVAGEDGAWGYRIFIVHDPDGNQLFFPYPAEASA